MASTVAKRLPDPPRRMLAATGESLQRASETRLRKSESVDPKVVLGRVVSRAIVIANLTPKDICFRLDYADTSIVGKWIAGVENPPMAKLLSLPEFRAAFLVAVSQVWRTTGVRVRTVVSVETVSA